MGMDREIVGHRFARQDMNDSYENYAKQKMRAKTEPKLEPCTGVSKCKLSLRVCGQKETSAWICWRQEVARVHCWWPRCLISKDCPGNILGGKCVQLLYFTSVKVKYFTFVR